MLVTMHFESLTLASSISLWWQI